jgi:hypothetical protein
MDTPQRKFLGNPITLSHSGYFSHTINKHMYTTQGSKTRSRTISEKLYAFSPLLKKSLGLRFNLYIREGLDHPKRPVLAYNTTSLTKTSTYI